MPHLIYNQNPFILVSLQQEWESDLSYQASPQKVYWEPFVSSAVKWGEEKHKTGGVDVWGKGAYSCSTQPVLWIQNTHLKKMQHVWGPLTPQRTLSVLLCTEAFTIFSLNALLQK